MQRKWPFIFAAVLAASYGLLVLLLSTLARDYETRVQQQSRIIHDDVRERFALFLRSPLTVGLLGAGELGHGQLPLSEYDRFAQRLIKLNRELLGINLLDASGKITAVYPPEENQSALGTVTQNLRELRNSLAAGESYWFSHPFRLYQGQAGFVFYVPVTRQGQHAGWVAAVISSRNFFNSFRAYNYFKDHDLIIKDELTGETYFATAVDPAPTDLVFESKSVVKGRTLIFQSWRKSTALSYEFPRSAIFLAALILAILLTSTLYLLQQRRQNRDQLTRINRLLGLTAREALTRLIDLSGKDRTPEDDSTYVTHLVEQIDLLQTMALGEEKLEEEEFSPLDVLEEELRHFSEFCRRKRVRPSLEEKARARIRGNRWLFQSGVLRNALTHCLILSQDDSELRLSLSHTGNDLTLELRGRSAASEAALLQERRLEVLRNVLGFFNGSLQLTRNEDNHYLLRLRLPVTGQTDRTSALGAGRGP
jgi:sensor domain CHASE-containing protein